MTGAVVRLYPISLKQPNIFDDLRIAGGVYEHPDRALQDSKKPKLYWR